MFYNSFFHRLISDIRQARTFLDLSEIRTQIVTLTSFTGDSYFSSEEHARLNTLINIRTRQLDMSDDVFLNCGLGHA